MKAPAIDQLVYECLFPKPKATDPQNFQGLLQRNLVPEVRLETQAFYGHLSSQEAKYPGLDYSYQPHRVRLSRYTWHRRLFRAFDNLGLTKSEIASLTKWEGTRWAKERFEREQGIVIRDTTSVSLFHTCWGWGALEYLMAYDLFSLVPNKPIQSQRPRLISLC
jgi:hypothetical protein